MAFLRFTTSKSSTIILPDFVSQSNNVYTQGIIEGKFNLTHIHCADFECICLIIMQCVFDKIVFILMSLMVINIILNQRLKGCFLGLQVDKIGHYFNPASKKERYFQLTKKKN